MEPDPQPQPPPAPNINIDFNWDFLINGIREILFDWGDEIADRAAEGTLDPINLIWDQLWASDANIFITPRALVTGFPPIVQLYHSLMPAAYGLALVSVVVLGMLILLRGLNGQGNLNGAVMNLFMGTFLGGSGWVIADSAIVLIGQISNVAGRQSFSPTFGFDSPNIWITALIALVALWFAIRLAYRMVYRTVLLGVLAPFGWLFGALYAIPWLRPLAGFYWWTYLGWAVGGFFAVVALSIGLQIALNGRHGIWGAIWGLVVLGIAHDLVPWLSRGSLVAPTPGVQAGIGIGARAAASTTPAGAAATAASGAASSAASSARGSAPYGYR